ncbi:MAG: Hsp70 family protein [Myxococcota bacterium]
MRLGIDFGTTNSAVAVLDDDGPRIVELAPGERTQRTVIHASLDGEVRFGNAAFRRYLEEDLSGRFLRSLKAFLAQNVPRTRLVGRTYSFDQLVAAYLRYLVDTAERVLGAKAEHVVVGRPVRYAAEPGRDAEALARFEAAIAEAGLASYELQLEPVAAAYAYERRLDRERIAFVGDFGGGTADFAVFRAGPGRLGQDRLDDVLGTAGVAQAGDALDGRFLETFLLDAFGKGATIRKRYTDEQVPWDHDLFRQIPRLYALHLLRTRELEEGLQRAEDWVSDPAAVRRLRRLVFDDLGYPLAWAIEASKRALSDAPTTAFRFDDVGPALAIERTVSLDRFAEGSAGLLAQYDEAVTEALAAAGVAEGDVDDVFLTGGTSQLPFVQDLFAARFDRERLRSADAFTSVCEGLAVAAGR